MHLSEHDNEMKAVFKSVRGLEMLMLGLLGEMD